MHGISVAVAVGVAIAAVILVVDLVVVVVVVPFLSPLLIVVCVTSDMVIGMKRCAEAPVILVCVCVAAGHKLMVRCAAAPASKV